MAASTNDEGIGVRVIASASRVAIIGSGLLLAKAAVELYAFRRDLARGVDYEDSFAVDGLYGAQQPGKPIVLGMLGDSLASGTGASVPEKTLAVRVALEMARVRQRPVRLINVARSGSGSRHLAEQTRQLSSRLGPDDRCDIVYVSVGAIDVSNHVPWGVARADIRTCAHDLTRTGAKVVFGMPDRASLATSFAGRPLVALACDAAMAYRAWQQRQFVDRMRSYGYGVHAANMSSVSRLFRENPHYTCGDRLHPSGAGQAVVAGILVPQLIAVLDDGGPVHPRPPTRRSQETPSDILINP